MVLIVAFCRTDTHMFRFLKGINPHFGYSMRFVHTISVGCSMEAGFRRPSNLVSIRLSMRLNTSNNI